MLKVVLSGRGDEPIELAKPIFDHRDRPDAASFASDHSRTSGSAVPNRAVAAPGTRLPQTGELNRFTEQIKPTLSDHPWLERGQSAAIGAGVRETAGAADTLTSLGFFRRPASGLILTKVVGLS